MTAFWTAEAGFDWQGYVSQHSGMRALRSRTDEYVLVCPDCGKAKLAVNVAKKAWQCFVCSDAGRGAASLISKVEQEHYGEAVKRVLSGNRRPIGNLDKVSFEEQESMKLKPRNFKPRCWPKGYKTLAKDVDEHIPRASAQEMVRAVRYCSDRKIPEYVVYEMALGICSFGQFKDRLMFPVFDFAGRLIFYQGRSMLPPKPYERYIKTLSPPTENEEQAGPGDCLLNLDYVYQQEIESILLVEGPIDCAHAWPDAVASFGKRISEKQMELLVRAGVKRVDICWDNDAVDEMMKRAPQLADMFEVNVVYLPQGKDPGELSKEEIESYRQNAVPYGNGNRLYSINTPIES